MCTYFAVTRTTPERCTALLRITKEGIIEQYYTEQKSWSLAQSGMSGIYCREVEGETITKEQADRIINAWNCKSNL